MTPQEFKAWFEGFTEAFDRLPTKAQWARVKERVAEIDGKPVTERIYVDRYWRQYAAYPSWTYLSASCGASSQSSLSNATAVGTYAANTLYSGQASQNFNSSAAMSALGRADAKALS